MFLEFCIFFKNTIFKKKYLLQRNAPTGDHIILTSYLKDQNSKNLEFEFELLMSHTFEAVE